MASLVHVEVRLGLSSPTISLSESESDPPVSIITTAKIVSSTQEDGAVTISIDGTVLNNGRDCWGHNGLFWGAFHLTNIQDRGRGIILGGGKHVSSRYPEPESMDMRQWVWKSFKTIPAMGQGELRIEHSLPLSRVFSMSLYVKINDVRPGDAFRMTLSRQIMERGTWWAFGDLATDLKDKKFSHNWIQEDGEWDWLLPGEETPDVDKMEADGWVFGHEEKIIMTAAKNEEVVLTFTA